ncbi:hypothetical protein MTP99_005902 [Tenebrio molitor]|nr:hypothetical protein MTP99_005902 [Tenebrio molitor]
MKEAKERYKKMIEDAKEKSWRSFVERDLVPNPWGVIYKMACKKITKKGVLGAFLYGGNYTRTKEEAMRYLLDELLPDDNDENEEEQQKEWRQNHNTKNNEYQYNIDEVSQEELDSIVLSRKNNKAPGLDGLKGRTIKIIHPFVGDFLRHVMNSCLRTGYFPKIWKKGNLKVLPKNLDGEMDNPKNYRPITLLPEHGKIFEKIIKILSSQAIYLVFLEAM